MYVAGLSTGPLIGSSTGAATATGACAGGAATGAAGTVRPGKGACRGALGARFLLVTSFAVSLRSSSALSWVRFCEFSLVSFTPWVLGATRCFLLPWWSLELSSDSEPEPPPEEKSE